MRPARARSLLVDLYGAFVRDLGGWIAVAHLVRLLGDLGVDEQAVRSSVSRLTRRGLLARRVADGRVGYALTPEAEALLAEGDRRIYEGTSPADLADGWVLAVFSVPERERGKRHQLRTQLVWHGFGNLGAGVWLAPRRCLEPAREAVERLGLADCVDLFAAHHAAFGDAAGLVARCWDLDELAAGYEAFVGDARPVLARWRRRVLDAGRWDREAFVDYVTHLHAWRTMPFGDPGLPAEVLPGDWRGAAARTCFDELVARLHEPAARHVAAVVEGG